MPEKQTKILEDEFCSFSGGGGGGGGSLSVYYLSKEFEARQLESFWS